MSTQSQRQQSAIACEECRRKRIRCDRGTPQCTACATSGANCVVRESCPPRGPKKGYLKALQKKIEDLQEQLGKQQDASTTETRAASPVQEVANIPNDDGATMEGYQSIATVTPIATGDMQAWPASTGFPFSLIQLGPSESMDNMYSNSPFTALDHYQEPQITMGPELQITSMMHNDLDQLYFDRAYGFAPILQPHRYRLWSKQHNKSKQKKCLQYAMWTLASSLSGQFQIAVCQLYAETRQLLHTIESEEPYHQISIEQAQAWTLLTIYELTCEDFHRGMMSAGRAFRLVQMMRLYEIDVAQSPPESQSQEQDHGQLALQRQIQDDWIDIETKRRTFWLAYTIDRFTSMVDGMHMFFDERMIRTRLPAPEANFASGRPTDSSFLTDMIQIGDLDWPDNDLSSFTETVIIATVCGRVLEHKQRPPSTTRVTTYEFCRQHRLLNALLAQRIKILRMYSSLEYLDSILTFSALAAHIAVLMLYDLIESKPLGNEGQATQLTKALQMEHQQQSLDAVADIALLVAALGQHFQMHPLTPILLLLGARYSQSHPGLNDAYTTLMPCIVTALQAFTSLNRLAQNFLQILAIQNDNWRAFG